MPILNADKYPNVLAEQKFQRVGIARALHCPKNVADG